MNTKLTYTYTSKVLLNNNLYVNLSCKLSDYGSIGKRLTSVYKLLLKDQVTWQRFQTLTKQEKRIIKLLAEGNTNKIISDKLCISIETVKTHRKNIYKKLDINNLGNLLNVALVLDFQA
jgi:DNA-binding CsgD family transcriptional regulator